MSPNKSVPSKTTTASKITASSVGLPVYHIGLLLSLYLAQGLPVGFLTQA